MSKVEIDLASATITAMSAALRQRDISPVELVQRGGNPPPVAVFDAPAK